MEIIFCMVSMQVILKFDNKWFIALLLPIHVPFAVYVVIICLAQTITACQKFWLQQWALVF